MSLQTLDSFLNKPHPASSSSPGHPIVLVDDDQTIRDALGMLLGRDYQLTTCASAIEGVAAVNDDVCAVILDVKMAGNDGFWACREIRKKIPDVPIIFFSAYQNLKDPYAIINDHRPFGYVQKGGDIRKLVELVRVASELQAMVVANRKLLQDLQRPEPLNS
jgi:DNA-binding NtrC family response regulator